MFFAITLASHLRHESKKTRNRRYQIQKYVRGRLLTALTRDPGGWNATKRGPKVIYLQTAEESARPSKIGWLSACLI